MPVYVAVIKKCCFAGVRQVEQYQWSASLLKSTHLLKVRVRESQDCLYMFGNVRTTVFSYQ